MFRNFLILFVTLFSVNAFAQVATVDSLESSYLNWYNKSPEVNEICGTGVERAYSTILKDKKPKKIIIVAVIDNGVDIDHVDLKEHIWTNEGEIPDNGIDDDKNGYIDDVHGWNFIGNTKGEHLTGENLELTRIYRDNKDKFEGKTIGEVSDEDKKMYTLYVAAKKEYLETKKSFTASEGMMIKMLNQQLEAEKKIKSFLGKDIYTSEDLKLVKDKDTSLNQYVEVLQKGFSTERLQGAVNFYTHYLDYYLNVDLNARKKVIGDNPFSMNEKNYGNPNVKGEFPDHGSMVSGIIGAVRNNEIGINGIATALKIIPVRTIPDGDEYDKDVALAIRYAVDNGANIINMSFGKAYSPMEEEVYAAIKYAEDKGVLLVKAAGNDGVDIETITQYPTPYSLKGNLTSSFLTVGANSKEFGLNMTASFSNYGSEKVQLFAPGVKVISISPDDNYNMMNGTSFSCPVVTGVATLVWSYYPELTASELRDILIKSTAKYKKMKVNLPGSFKEGEVPMIKFGKLSESGGVVNAYNALLLAEKVVAKKKK